MDRKTQKNPNPRTSDPRALAREAADRYFTALASEIPCDAAPGDVNLIAHAVDIQAVIESTRSDEDIANDPLDAALLAGYLLGIEVGRRLAGGAR
jgi:hypothetical protein